LPANSQYLPPVQRHFHNLQSRTESLWKYVTKGASSSENKHFYERRNVKESEIQKANPRLPRPEADPV